MKGWNFASAKQSDLVVELITQKVENLLLPVTGIKSSLECCGVARRL